MVGLFMRTGTFLGITVLSASTDVLFIVWRIYKRPLETSLHPMNTMDFIRSVSSFMCCNYIPPGSIRIYCPLIKMSTKNVTFWPQEDDFYKILFFIVV